MAKLRAGSKAPKGVRPKEQDGWRAFVAGLRRRLATAEKMERVMARSIRKDTDLLAAGEIHMEDSYLEKRRRRLKTKQQTVKKLRELIEIAELSESAKSVEKREQEEAKKMKKTQKKEEKKEKKKKDKEEKDKEEEEGKDKKKKDKKKYKEWRKEARRARKAKRIARRDKKQKDESAKSELRTSNFTLCEDGVGDKGISSEACDVHQPSAAGALPPNTVAIKVEDNSDDDDVKVMAQVVPAPASSSASSSACCPGVAVPDPDRAALLQDALRLLGTLLAPQPACCPCCCSGATGSHHHLEPSKEPKREPQ